MDLHCGGSSPLAHLPLGQGTDSEQTPSCHTVWVVGVGAPPQLARKHSRPKPRVRGTFTVPVLAGCWCLVLSHNWDNDDLPNVLNLSQTSSVFCTAESPVVHHDIMSPMISSTCWTCGSATVACTVESHALVVSSSQRRSRSCRCTAPVGPSRLSGSFRITSTFLHHNGTSSMILSHYCTCGSATVCCTSGSNVMDCACGTSINLLESGAAVIPFNGHVRDLIKELHLEHLKVF